MGGHGYCDLRGLTVVNRLSAPLVKVRRYTFSVGWETVMFPPLDSMGRVKRIFPLEAGLSTTTFEGMAMYAPL
jgi:hypothetical protein